MPRDILEIAAAVKKLYLSIFKMTELENDLTEMKMHKLLYFCQKRHYENFGIWLFADDFEGWVHGPVNKKVRNNFHFLDENVVTSDEEEYTIREIIHELGSLPAWTLRELSHNDECYKISRLGLSDYDQGNVIIAKENMIMDMLDIDEDSVLQ
ncbi:Panacea domain-containing protein [Paenibacillus sp. FSL R5-0810]|uniref:Panacea domain-containing protein n=1 Tax=Paenibacillus sp. FSL R5-0810 TaxID=2921659 RepID=UPI0030F8850A